METLGLQSANKVLVKQIFLKTITVILIETHERKKNNTNRNT
jgi:hypothetical protein